MADTFTMPEHGIMCFHCGEVFMTYGSARDHFGSHEWAEAGCLVDQVAVEEGGKPERGRGLLMALRKMEAERDELRTRVQELEMQEHVYESTNADLRRYFGTTSPWAIHDRLSNAEFRAEHAVNLLDAHNIPFDSVVT